MLLDTNILIAILADEEMVVKKADQWRAEGELLTISAVNITEALSLPILRANEVEVIKCFVQSFFIFSLDQEIAIYAGALRRLYGLTLPDASIAATAIIHRHTLVTRDKGFRKILELTLIEI